MEKTIKLYALSYSEVKTYWMASLFIVGNILLPQLCHLIPQGGVTWLPIYFFTLIGAYKYGWKVGLLTAVISPIVNSWAFGMPALPVLPFILIKSTLLALAAGYTAQRSKTVSWTTLFIVIMLYQVLGTLGEFLISGNMHTALQDFRIGLPGMTLQLVGGYTLLNIIKD